MSEMWGKIIFKSFDVSDCKMILPIIDTGPERMIEDSSLWCQNED